MKKLFQIFLVILCLKICFAIAMLFYIDNLVKKEIEHLASNILKAEVTLDKVSISFFKSRISLREFKIANPPGYKSPYFLKTKKVVIKINYKTIFDKMININELALVQPDFYYEDNDQGVYNAEVLNDNVQNSARIKDAEAKPAKFTVNAITIGKGVVRTSGDQKKEIVYPGRTLTYVGGADNGVTTNDIAAIIMQTINDDFQVLGLKNWVHNLIDNFFDKTVPALKENIHNAIQNIKKQ
jgi:uncharacterized protein involved in outer membrane biogenesis